MAFLAAMVGPKVAAASAQRALEVLAEEDPAVAAEAAALQQGAVQNGQGPSGRSAAPGGGTDTQYAHAHICQFLHIGPLNARDPCNHRSMKLTAWVVNVLSVTSHVVSVPTQNEAKTTLLQGWSCKRSCSLCLPAYDSADKCVNYLAAFLGTIVSCQQEFLLGTCC